MHKNWGDVIDFTYWVIRHDGNDQARNAGRRNPIAHWAAEGSARIEYPPHHDMKRWRQFNGRIGTTIGKLGDSIDFAVLPTSLQTPEMVSLHPASFLRPLPPLVA